jgi:hypothetical protein
LNRFLCPAGRHLPTAGRDVRLLKDLGGRQPRRI